MNYVFLVGRLTREPELRQTTNNTSVCTINLAVSRRFGKNEGQPDADFINVVTWAKTAEFVSKYFQKGMRVYVVGRIQTRSWEDDSGNRRYVTEVIANEVGFADGRKDNGNGDRAKGEEIYEDDLPF